LDISKMNYKTTNDSQNDLTKKAYLSLRRMLFHNEIVPDQKIPFLDLAKKFEMSPTPVIQALKFLEFQGLIRREPNRGYYMEPLSMDELQQIYELRELLEGSLVSEAINRLDENGIHRLNSALEAHLAAVRDIYSNKRILQDIEFHLTLASLAQKSLQQKTLQDVFDLLSLKYRNSMNYVTLEKPVDSDHQLIFNAVVSRDILKAQAIISKHIIHAKTHALISLKRMMKEKEE
jgi:DNA-binding GntR family transcriptional regulator